MSFSFLRFEGEVLVFASGGILFLSERRLLRGFDREILLSLMTKVPKSAI